MQNTHTPVLISKILEYTQTPGLLADLTFGGGGYTKNFLAQGHKVLACDKDKQAFEYGKKSFSAQIETAQLKLFHQSFETFIINQKPQSFDYIVADLGFSSNQLEHSNRGFSYLKPNEDLDLRYNTDEGSPTWKAILKLEPKDLGKKLFRSSGETLSARIANKIWEANQQRKRDEDKPLIQVKEFLEVIDQAIPKKLYHKRYGIYSRIWQGFRIMNNREFEVLEEMLSESLSRLKPGGKLIIVCFHSLEDKMVTKFMRQAAIPVDIDDYGNKETYYSLLTKKAVTPDESEITENPRSRSATLRLLEKL
jgi:16S rRNA (cytosine1402-N4)-methyltransferase